MVRRAFFVLLAGSTVCWSQVQPVSWTYDVSIGKENRPSTLTLTAAMAQGWHLYSQFIDEGGPIPTTFQFITNSSYVLEGAVKETGDLARFHDETYDMMIGWYTDKVTFEQVFRPVEKAALIVVKIEYMVCNDHVCVPGHKEFRIPVTQLP